MCVNNLPKVALGTVAAGIRTRDMLIASPSVVVPRRCMAALPRRSVS